MIPVGGSCDSQNRGGALGWNQWRSDAKLFAPRASLTFLEWSEIVAEILAEPWPPGVGPEAYFPADGNYIAFLRYGADRGHLGDGVVTAERFGAPRG